MSTDESSNRISGIYILQNKINGKYYIGQSVNLQQRLRCHYNSSGNQLISKAIKKHGWNQFDVTLWCVPIDRLDITEQFFIHCYNSLSPGGYNLDSGGSANKFLSEETKAKISATRNATPGNYGNPGKPKTAEHRAKMSVAHKGKSKIQPPHTEEAKAKISAALKGKNRTAEQKERMAASQRGKKISPEIIAKGIATRKRNRELKNDPSKKY